MINNILIYSLLAFSALAILVTYFVLKRLKKLNHKTFYIVIASLAILFFCLRYFQGNSHIFGLWTDWDSRLVVTIQVMFIWLALFNFLIVMLNAFFDIKVLRMLNNFFTLPCIALNIALAFIVANGGIISRTMYGEFNLQLLFYGLELGVTFACSIIVATRSFLEKKTKQDWINFALALLPMIFVCIPVDSLRVFTGAAPDGVGYYFKDFFIAHRVVLYFMAAIPIALFFALRKKSKHVIKFALLFISLATLLTMLKGNLKFLHDFTELPLHLCIAAMYIIPICLIFNMKRLFYFTYLVNVLGAIIAMLMPDWGPVMIWSDDAMWAFILNHFTVFIIPILMVALGLYERPKLKQFKYSIVAFSIYFVLILIINAWFSNYGSATNYFYANTDFVADQLGNLGGFVRQLREITWEFDIGSLHFLFYPVYQLIFFLVYVGLALGMWFVYELGFQAAEGIKTLFSSSKKIKLDELAFKSQLKDRPLTEPNEEGIDMLRIIDFSKKYGLSKEFAVKKANLEVNAGEIFGFLGPNGAGKSTIIKSIVGIQPPTSGKIEVCGFDVMHQDVEAKKQIGFVPDHYALYEKLTGREYINYMADLYDISKEERDKRVKDLVARLQLENAFDSQIKTYSHGMKQKIAIIAALIHNPKLWILDEPLTGLDPTSIFQVKEIMKEYAKQGNIIFFSSHIIDVVERICDRIAIIKKGKIESIINLSELAKNNSRLEEYYLSVIEAKEDKQPKQPKTKKKPEEAE